MSKHFDALAQDSDVGRLNAAEAEQLLASLGFLLVPGPPFDRGPAYLLVALRKAPTLAHFDPERIELWTSGDARPTQVVLEWPMQSPSTSYSWGTIDVVDRIGAANRFASFGGVLSMARDRDIHAVLFRSGAPILSAGGHSGPADPLGTSVASFFGILRAAAGNDRRVGELIRSASPDALYAAFLARSLAAHEGRHADENVSSRLVSLLRDERRRLERDAAADLRTGVSLAALLPGR